MKSTVEIEPWTIVLHNLVFLYNTSCIWCYFILHWLCRHNTKLDVSQLWSVWNWKRHTCSNFLFYTIDHELVLNCSFNVLPVSEVDNQSTLVFKYYSNSHQFYVDWCALVKCFNSQFEHILMKRNESLPKDLSRTKVTSNWIGLNMISHDNS